MLTTCLPHPKQSGYKIPNCQREASSEFEGLPRPHGIISPLLEIPFHEI